PTHEALDPVRFIGNNSSGKMGFAIAEELANQGAKVTLVSGPTALSTSHPNIEVLRVTSAEEMYNLSVKAFPGSDIAVLSAAVADFRPESRAENKIKKSDNDLTIKLVKNKDIALELGKKKRKDQVIVGFALETENELANAKQKIAAKNFDLIVLNSLKDEGAGFGHDTNKVSLITKAGTVSTFDTKSKKEVASDIVNGLIELYG
ncbi:MAG: phosphopantothenoylcysteine decarboxylase, partial [Cyclobacteriaceae bacterium]